MKTLEGWIITAAVMTKSASIRSAQGDYHMLNEHTVVKMEALRLYGMAQSFKELTGRNDQADLAPAEFAGILVDAETTHRDNEKLKRLLFYARLKQQACLEDIDYAAHRGLLKRNILELAACQWIKNKENILISGPTGIGKSYLVCALGNAACRKGYRVLYMRAPKLFATLFQSRGDGSYLKYLAKLSRFDVLVIDDMGLSPMTENERKDFLEIVEDRNMTSSIIIASQLPVKDYYQIIGDPTIADAICDRLLHNAHKIELKGESMRKKAKQSASDLV
jgi:DNA replication protein DnaC